MRERRRRQYGRRQRERERREESERRVHKRAWYAEQHVIVTRHVSDGALYSAVMMRVMRGASYGVRRGREKAAAMF